MASRIVITHSNGVDEYLLFEKHKLLVGRGEVTAYGADGKPIFYYQMGEWKTLTSETIDESEYRVV